MERNMVSAPEKLKKSNDWSAAVMQSGLLIVSFVIIAVGVVLEHDTPYGLMNGFWALSLVAPATGFLLSLTNWHFVGLYKSRKSFSNYSMLVTVGITVCAYLWTWYHYKIILFEKIYVGLFDNAIEKFLGAAFYCGGLGYILTVVFCVLSKLLASKYAALLGKE